MKKLVTLLCALLVVATLAGCNKKHNSEATEATADEVKLEKIQINVDTAALQESLQALSEAR